MVGIVIEGVGGRFYILRLYNDKIKKNFNWVKFLLVFDKCILYEFVYLKKKFCFIFKWF